MTSECFVYITLPGETDSVVAGRLETGVKRDVPFAAFVYGRSYLERANAVSVDPLELSVLDGTTVERTGDQPLFSSIRDASPDAWGRRVIERELGGEPDEMGYLLHSPDDRAGALGFGTGPKPPAPQRKFNKTIQLQDLLDAASLLDAGNKPEDNQLAIQVQQLQLLGTSMGGARPKAVVEDDSALWVAKFPRRDDQFNQPRVEHAMLELARTVGLQVAPSRIVSVGDRAVLFVKRFDREWTERGYLRHRMISGLTTLQASDAPTDRGRWSYLLLADQLRRFDVEESKSRQELFRRMVFNALISNVDDHPRNHAMIADAKGWRLSPAYDLTPTPLVAQFDRSLAMTVGEAGRVATALNLVSRADAFGIARDEALSIVADTRTIVNAEWYNHCRAAGATVPDCEFISSAFDYEGFDVDDVLDQQAALAP